MADNNYTGPSCALGILGGGQLALMLIEEAIRVGITVLVWAQRPDEPALRLATHYIIAPWDDDVARIHFGARVNYITFESENVPAYLIADYARLAAIGGTLRYVHPSAEVQAIASNRIQEKLFCQSLGIRTAPFAVLASDGPAGQSGEMTFPAILKTARGGYDGRDQHIVTSWREARLVRKDVLKQAPCVLEAKLDFDYEFSVIVARDRRGMMRVYDPIENRHRNGILVESLQPGPSMSKTVCGQGKDIAQRMAVGLNLTGIMAVEMFAMKDKLVLVNEIAPRPHNSGHGTIEGNKTSQYRMLLDIILGQKLGPTDNIRPWRMRNCLGMSPEEMRAHTPQGAVLHDYGKEPRAGRKVGHIFEFL